MLVLAPLGTRHVARPPSGLTRSFYVIRLSRFSRFCAYSYIFPSSSRLLFLPAKNKRKPENQYSRIRPLRVERVSISKIQKQTTIINQGRSKDLPVKINTNWKVKIISNEAAAFMCSRGTEPMVHNPTSRDIRAKIMTP